MMRRRQVLAEFGDIVLDHEDMDEVLGRACRLIAEALGAELAKVIQIERTADVGLIRAGIGWNEGIVGHERIPLSEDSAEACAIARSEPVIANDIDKVTRFRFAPVLRDHGVVALVNVPIFLSGRRPWGVLQVGSRTPRDFSEKDIEFLKTYAMLLGPVIDRIETVRQHEEARAAIEEREQHLHRILDGMGEGFGILAPDFTILEHNREATRMDGRAREEIVGRSHWEAYPGTEESELGRTLKKAMAEQVPVTLEHFITLSSGEGMWLEMRAYPTGDGGLAVFWRDVTARRRATDALLESRRRLEATFESVPAAVAAIDRRGTAVLANQRYLAIFPVGTIPSRDPERIHRWHGWDAEGRPLPPDQWPGSRALRGESVLPGQEMLYATDDGREIWTSIATMPTRDDDGAITGFVTVVTDITERKATETALRESESRLQTLIQGIPQLVWRAAPHGAWTWASPQWEDFTGLSSEDSAGDGWLAALHPDDRAAARQAWADAAGRERLAFDCRLCHAATDEYRWFQTRALPVRDAGGAIVEWLGTCTDVHDLRQLQERQRVLVGELQHRTRNLIGVIGSVCDKTARSSANFAEFRSKFLDRLHAMSRVQGLLSRIEREERVNFDDLIAAEFDALGAHEAASKVILKGPRGVGLRSSGVQTLAMALHELTTNAIKHGALGQDGARLEVSWDLEAGEIEGGPWLRIDWRESGVQIPAGAADKIGQGRELIEKALPYQLGAHTDYRFAPDGVRCTIRIAVSNRQKANKVDT
jgi:PAS domain S-box-containing protein